MQAHMDILVIESRAHASDHLIELLAAHEWVAATRDLASPDLPLAAPQHDLAILHCHTADAELVRRVRAEIGIVPLIAVMPVCTARELAAALEAGADDALAYPFEPLELAERVRALARRAGWQRQAAGPAARLSIDRGSRSVHVNGHLVLLTSMEFDLLCYLDDRRARTVTVEEITHHVHGTSHQDGGVVRQLVHKLRKKLGNEVPIITRRGKGYSLALPGATAVPNAITRSPRGKLHKK